MRATQKTEMLRVRASPNLKSACAQAATAAGLSFSDWVRAVMARAASEGWLALPDSGKRKTRKRRD